MIEEAMSDTTKKIRELAKEEILERWDEVWTLLQKLINHLRKSPVFYPGVEFTEEVYKAFLLEKNTKVIVAEMEEQWIGIMTSSKDGNSFINKGSNYYNVGDVYIEPKYRGGMMAQTMLMYMSGILKADGIEKLWVEHGTANPNARGFWNKYFKTYSYVMIREIEPF